MSTDAPISPVGGVLQAHNDFEERKCDYNYVVRGIILGVFLGFFACIGTFFIGPSSPPKVIKDQLRDHNPEYQLAYRDKGGELTKKAKRNSYLGASLLLGLLNVFAWLLFPLPQ